MVDRQAIWISLFEVIVASVSCICSSTPVSKVEALTNNQRGYSVRPEEFYFSISADLRGAGLEFIGF
jgi:hypothetical protein